MSCDDDLCADGPAGRLAWTLREIRSIIRQRRGRESEDARH
ncbi:MAG TPA: hypothetical protein VFN54_08520 [Acidimicrobiales bacterium]|nr:hypothetical protein [Acidimicrobiales bacterium]